MGREIRRVPPDWLHPESRQVQYRGREGLTAVWAHTPLLDQSLREAQEAWDAQREQFDREDKVAEHWTEEDEQWSRERYSNDGTIRAGKLKYPNGFIDCEGPRPPQWDDDGILRVGDWYRPDWPEETRTAYQVYETVSEGTPIGPVFETEEDLVKWLIDPTRDASLLPLMSEEAAMKFVELRSVPSLMVSPGVGIAANVEMLEPGFAAMREP